MAKKQINIENNKSARILGASIEISVIAAKA
jgi:hypothetical protein